MCRMILASLLMGFALSGSSPPAIAQGDPNLQFPEAPEAHRAEHLNLQPTTDIAGEELPDYYVVRTFFSMTQRMRELGGDYFARYLRKILEISPESPAAGRIADFASLGSSELRRIVVSRADVERLLESDPEQLEEMSRAGNDQKAQNIGELYGQLMADLADLGVDVAALHHRIDDEFRPAVSVSLTADSDVSHMLRKDMIFRNAVAVSSSVLQEVDQ